MWLIEGYFIGFTMLGCFYLGGFTVRKNATKKEKKIAIACVFVWPATIIFVLLIEIFAKENRND